MVQQKEALAELKTCFDKADSNYSKNWTSQCLANNEADLDECKKRGFSQAVCQQNLPLNKNCSLSVVYVSRLTEAREYQKDECTKFYKFSVTPMGDYSK